MGKPGAMTLFHATPQEHLALAKHLTAEMKTEEFIAGKGIVTKWERLNRNNHWFDALYNACAAGHPCGVRLVDEQPPPEPLRTRVRSPYPQDPDSPWVDPQEWINRGRDRW